MTTFRIRLDQRARKNLASLDPVVRRRIAKALDALSTDPRPAGCKSLKGLEGVMRIRVGDYRILYLIHADEPLLDVVDIDHRKDIYR